MKRVLAGIIIAVTVSTAAFAQTVDVNHFLLGPSINGESGFISNPAAYVLPHMSFNVALHRFTFKSNIGLFDIVETGLSFYFSNTTDLWQILQGGGVNLKAKLLKEEDYFVSIAAGIEKMPFNWSSAEEREDFKTYLVFSKKIDDMNFSLGVKKSLIVEDLDFLVWNFMADVSKVIGDMALVIFEYDTDQFNAGLKISLNYNISVEIFIVDLEQLGDSGDLGVFLEEHFIFGISYLQ